MKRKMALVYLAIFGVGALIVGLVGGQSTSASIVLQNVASTVETQPVTHSGDAADDPSIWINPLNPALSLVIGNDKKGALESYDLAGKLVQRVTTGTTFWGNVDVRGNYVVAANGGIRVYQINPSTRLMTSVTNGGVIKTSGEGLCLYDPGQPGTADGLYAFTITRSVGRVRQYQLNTNYANLISANLVRDFTIGTEAEGCAADDITGNLFISEEDNALWRYGANPSDGTARTMVAAVGPDLPSDAEGVTIAAGYLFVSAQNVTNPNNNWVNVYKSTAPYTYVKSFRVTNGSGSDDCDRTDSIATYAGYLGPNFASGIFVCQDNSNGAPGNTGNQNFKYTPFSSLGL